MNEGGEVEDTDGSGEEPGDDEASGPGGLSVGEAAIAPQSPGVSEALVATAKAVGEGATLAFQWYVNGEPAPGAFGETFGPGPYKKGDKVAVEIVAQATSGDASEPVRKEVQIRNSPPSAAAGALPAEKIGTYLRFRLQATDPDGDALKYSVEKPVAGVTVSEDGTVTIEPGKAPGGESVIVTVSDGSATAQIPFTVPSN